jgi:eukaryotic-like serine/threonine-protein kinase
VIGKDIAHYKVTARIGAGGMGEVYRARDTRLEREVAIKVLPAATLGDDAARSRFRKEALALARLNHPHIGMVFDFNTLEGRDFLVMELVEGESLSAKLKPGSLPEPEIVRLGAQIASALEEAHARNIIHRDLKPGNILITPKGQAKVLDFGLARLLAPEAGDLTASLSEMHGVAGTLPYMAPEQLRGKPADARSDIWSLGIVLYEMAAGKPPFQGTTGFVLSSAILNQPPPSLPASVSAGLREVIEHCLEKDPARRYQRADEVRAALESFPEGKAISSSKPAGGISRRGAFVAAGLLALAAAIGAVVKFADFGDAAPGTEAVPKIESLAVLPLENLSGDPAQEYFADGMTEALITELAQLKGLKKVTSRTSVMQFKKSGKSMAEIAKVLGVDAIIEGSVQRSGERVGITVQLIDPVADRHLWAKSYERDITDILRLQREVAGAIAREIRVQLTPEEITRVAKARPVNPAAHNAYLLGRYYTEKRTAEAIDKAVEALKEAIALDRQFAPAHAALSRAYAERDIWGRTSMGESVTEIRAEAEKALELDPNLAEAHFALASVLADHDWDWSGAEAEFARALELNPHSTDVLHASAFFYQTIGRDDEALKRIRQAVDLAPTTVTYVDSEGRILYRARRYTEAIASYERALTLDSGYRPTYQRLADAYLMAGRAQDALDTIEKGARLVSDGGVLRRRLAYIYARTGRRKEARDLLREIARQEGTRRSTFELASGYAALGDGDRALTLLEQAVERRAIIPLQLRDPRFDAVREHPRFRALMKKMRLPE